MPRPKKDWIADDDDSIWFISLGLEKPKKKLHWAMSTIGNDIDLKTLTLNLGSFIYYRAS